MPVSTSLAVPRIDVSPGGSATVELTVRNTGAVVDEFRVEILGAPAAWTTASPEVVPLFPGASAQVVLTFAPPRRSETAAGDLDAAVKVSSREDPEGSSVEEIVVTVGGFDAPDAELIPRTVRGRRGAKVQIAVDNLGNRRTQRAIAVADADDALRFEHDPAISVEAGRAEFVDLKIKPVKVFFKGQEKSQPYKVRLEDGDSVVNLDGTFVQSALLPRWLIRALIALLALLLAFLLFWQLALKPVIRSTAKSAAEKQVEKDAKKIGDAVVAAQTPGGSTTTTAPDSSQSAAEKAKAAAAKKKADEEKAAADKAAAIAAQKAAAAAGGDDGKGGVSTDKRLAVTAEKGKTERTPWTPGDGKGKFLLTDIVLQNPSGDSGLLRIKRGEGDDDILLESALENFRDLDFHYIAPFVVAGKPLVLEVECTNNDPANKCTAAATLSGFLAAPPEAAGASESTTTTKVP